MIRTELTYDWQATHPRTPRRCKVLRAPPPNIHWEPWERTAAWGTQTNQNKDAKLC